MRFNEEYCNGGSHVAGGGGYTGGGGGGNTYNGAAGGAGPGGEFGGGRSGQAATRVTDSAGIEYGQGGHPVGRPYGGGGGGGGWYGGGSGGGGMHIHGQGGGGSSFVGRYNTGSAWLPHAGGTTLSDGLTDAVTGVSYWVINNQLGGNTSPHSIQIEIGPEIQEIVSPP